MRENRGYEHKSQSFLDVSTDAHMVAEQSSDSRATTGSSTMLGSHHSPVKELMFVHRVQTIRRKLPASGLDKLSLGAAVI